MNQPRFRTLLLEALREFADYGYTSETDLQDWLMRLQFTLEREMPTDRATLKAISTTLEAIFNREIRTGIERRVPGVERYTIDQVAPELRAELSRRIYAAADLIRINKAAAMAKTLQRFSGWASSVPQSAANSRKPLQTRDIATEILKPIKQLRFEHRRVAIDQGAKLSAAVSHVVAMGQGAIACVWHDRGEKDRSYDARPAHLARSGKLFLVRDSWAMDGGLIRRGALPYYDDLEDPAAQLPFCSCYVTWIVSPREMPDTTLTRKGREWLKAAA